MESDCQWPSSCMILPSIQTWRRVIAPEAQREQAEMLMGRRPRRAKEGCGQLEGICDYCSGEGGGCSG